MLDSLGMLGAALALPEQMATARDAVGDIEPLPSATGISSVLIAGMGGSGIAGDVAAAVLPGASVPIVVSKGYECPGFVGPNTLVIGVSFSGNTEETVSVLEQASERGAPIVVLCAGGRLADFADRGGYTRLPLDASIPMPRAAIGALTVPVLITLERLALAAGADAQISDAIDQLVLRRSQLDVDPTPVTDVSRRIGRTLPIIYGAGPLGAVAASRWKGQFNENPKVAAFANRVPELTHNEICGWGQHGDVTRQVFSLVLLRHGFEHRQEARRMELVAEICEEIVADVIEVEARGEGRLAQLMDLVMVGDLVTLRCAQDAGVDPGPVPILDDIKARLAAT